MTMNFKRNLNWLKAITITATAALVTSVAIARPTMFCRDCPFPAKVADGRWVMPNGVIQVEIGETFMPKHMNQVDILLRDTRSGEVIAKGVVFQRRDRRTVKIDLMDKEGRQIKGFVRYNDHGHETIQAKFSCEQCAIAPMLE